MLNYILVLLFLLFNIHSRRVAVVHCQHRTEPGAKIIRTGSINFNNLGQCIKLIDRTWEENGNEPYV